MQNIDSILITEESSIRETLQKIDASTKQIALVVNDQRKLLGTVTDGDIRRGLLKGLSLDDSVESIIFRTPTTAKLTDSKESIIKQALAKKIHQIPIIDVDGCIVGLKEIEELVKATTKSNQVVLMVGGLGSRLYPLTQETPKPLLNVGGKPILQTIVERLAEYGFVNIVMCVNYKANMIQDHFGDGSQFGANIEYILEDDRMGTAGALSLLTSKPIEPFIVMNGDLLTSVNFENLLDYHLAQDAVATMCVREYDFQVPYGVVHLEGNKVKSIIEKPVHKFFVSAGIYMLSPHCINLIPQKQYYDMPTLFEKLIETQQNAVSFPIHEYWLDIGRMNEYEQANREYSEVFG